MPSYNHEEYVATAIESVLNQTYEDVELLIVDDASEDESPEIIREYENESSRIRAIYHEENQGIPKTVNQGRRQAEGEYLAVIDSDEVWKADKIERQIDIVRGNPPGVVWSEGEVIDENGERTGELFSERQSTRKRQKSGAMFEELLKGNLIYGGSAIYPADTVGRIDYDESIRFHLDYVFWLELSYRYPFYYIDEPLAQYRVHGENTSQTTEFRETTAQEHIDIYNGILDKYGDELSESEWWRIRMELFYHKLNKSQGRRGALDELTHAMKIRPIDVEYPKYIIYAMVSPIEPVRRFAKRVYDRVFL